MKLDTSDLVYRFIVMSTSVCMCDRLLPNGVCSGPNAYLNFGI